MILDAGYEPCPEYCRTRCDLPDHRAGYDHHGAATDPGYPVSLVAVLAKGGLAGVGGRLVAMPLILPPTVLGFYLLLLFAPIPRLALRGRLTGTRLAFSFSALVMGSGHLLLPFVVQPAANRIPAGTGKFTLHAATLGARPLDQFRSIVLPLTRRSFITAASLGFAHGG